MMEARVMHRVRTNETSRIPRRHIFLDTESKSRRTRAGHVQTWRVGVAAYHSSDKGRKPTSQVTVHRTARSLWTDVSEFAKPRARTILWAHNLAYDLRIADTFRALPALGWRLDAHNLASRGTWLTWRRDGATLCMVDATSVFPVPLAQVAKSFMQTKLRLPADDDPDGEWVARCTRDVEILQLAVLTYLEWLDQADLGSWQLTGAGQSYAAFRKRFLTHPMLVHNYPDALELERSSMWTGRCEAYYHGRVARGGVEEWDINLAYARLARDNEVPTQFMGPIDPRTPLPDLLSRPHTAIVASVVVETDRPCVPARVDGRICWPVGRFETDLWQPEIELARSAGAHVGVRSGFVYRTAPALKAWAEWIIDALRADNPDTPAWQRIILKHWARALIGRFGMSYTKWTKVGVTQQPGLMFTTVYDLRDGTEYDLTHIGDAVQREDGVVEWAQSQPAITGYIMSLARVWLHRLQQAMPANSVLYVDTDSILVHADHGYAAATLADSPLGAGLRLKTRYARAEILGPRQLILDGKVKASGIPLRATLLPGHRMEGEVWESLRQGVERGRSDAVVTTDRRWRLQGIDRRRAPGLGGWTQPLDIGGR